VGFVMCGFVYVWLLKCVGVCRCGFCNVCVCVHEWDCNVCECVLV